MLFLIYGSRTGSAVLLFWQSWCYCTHLKHSAVFAELPSRQPQRLWEQRVVLSRTEAFFPRASQQRRASRFPVSRETLALKMQNFSIPGISEY